MDEDVNVFKFNTNPYICVRCYNLYYIKKLKMLEQLNLRVRDSQ